MGFQYNYSTYLAYKSEHPTTFSDKTIYVIIIYLMINSCLPAYVVCLNDYCRIYSFNNLMNVYIVSLACQKKFEC